MRLTERLISPWRGEVGSPSDPGEGVRISECEDVFRILCDLLGGEKLDGCEHTRSLCDPVVAAALVALAEKERVGPALHERLVRSQVWQEAKAQRDLLANAWEQNLRRNRLI